MAYFAEIKDGVVLRVIVIEQKMLDTGLWGDPKNWVETKPDNYAGIGYAFDKSKVEFVPPVSVTTVISSTANEPHG